MGLYVSEGEMTTTLEMLRSLEAVHKRAEPTLSKACGAAAREIERLQTAADMDAKIILKLTRENERLRANAEQLEAAIRSHDGEPVKPPTGDHVEQLEAALWSYNTKWGNATIEVEKARTT